MLPGIQIGIGIGVGVTGMNAGGSPTPPPGYTTGAVSFDGGTGLENASLTADDNGLFSRSVWVLVQADNGPTLWASAGNVNYFDQGFPGSSSSGQVQMGFGDGVNHLGYDSPNGVLPTLAYYNILTSVNSNFDAGDKIIQVYVNDVEVASPTIDDASPSFVMTFNGQEFYVGTDEFGDFLTGYMADCWIAPGQFIDFSIDANRRKFIDADGKPVNLGSDGSTPTGTAPAIFLHIDSGGNPMDFRTNKGTGGNFSLFGEATTTGALVSGSAGVIVADTTGITAGVRVYATGVPGGTTVLSVDTDLSTVTMSAQASTTNPTADMQFGGVLQLAPSSPSD